MARANVRVSGAEQVAFSLEQVGLRAREARAVAPQIRSLFRTAQQRRFATNAGGRWPPLAARTLENKARRGQDLAILRATGALYRSLTGGGGQELSEAHAGEFSFGTRLDYARFLLPLRPPVGVTRDDVAAMAQIISDHVAGGGRG